MVWKSLWDKMKWKLSNGAERWSSWFSQLRVCRSNSLPRYTASEQSFSLQADQYINLSNPKPLPCLVLSPSVSVCLAPHLSFLQFRLSHTSHPSRSLSLHHCPLFFRACFSHRGMLADFINPSLALSLYFLTFDVWSECVILTSQLMCLLQHVH